MRARKGRLYIFILSILAVFAVMGIMNGSVLAGDSGRRHETFEVDQALLDSDVALAKSMAQLLAKQPMELKPLLARFDTSNIREDRAIGFGFRQLFLPMYGGYTTIWLKLVVSQERIVALECVQAGMSDSWRSIAPVIRKAWQRAPLESTETSDTFVTYVDGAKLDSVLSRELGDRPTIASPGSSGQSFDLLLSPFENLDVGSSCYYTGEKPAGRVAIDQLTAGGRYDLIRAVLRGPNPEGRTYAALALIKDQKMTPADATVVQKLKALNIPIHVCEGCTVSTQRFADIIH